MNTYIPLFPPLLAIALAISTRKSYLAIFSGIVLGSIILAPTLIAALEGVISSLFVTLQSTSTFQTLIFILMIGAIINMLQSAGAIDRALYLVTKKQQMIKNRYHAQLLTFSAGLLMCLEGIGSMMMVGVVGRPLFKRYNVSAEKLAFVANGTGAPIAWLLPISSAGLFLTGMIQSQIDQGVITGTALDLVIQAVPYQFYTVIVLVSVPLLSVVPFDFQHTSTPAKLESSNQVLSLDSTHHSLWVSLSPLYLLIASIIFIFVTLGDMSQATYLSGYVALIGSTFIFNANSIAFTQSVRWAADGAIHILPAVCILLLAFTFSGIIGSLGTGDVLAQLVNGSVPHQLLPAMIFLIGMAISFATGSSGATVSILLPIAIPMAVTMGSPLPIIVGAVISGSVFGDQSSPISDSVIVASSAAECSPERHFKTQLPIVTSVALIALFGFVAVGALSS